MPLHFLHPWVLLGLPILAWLAWWAGRRGTVPSVPVPSLSGLSALARVPKRNRGQWRWWLPLLALALGVILDFSRSMAEPDFKMDRKRITRRQALESVVGEFVKSRPQDRIGIVCFARNPYLISPLTLDHDWAIESLKQTDLMTGTGIGEALAASLRFLRKDSERNKVIILVTDGDNSAGRRPFEIAPMAVRDKVKVYSILIGPEIVTPTAAANHELNRVSRLTGGQFFQATDTKGLQGIYNLIDQLEKKALVAKRLVTWRELHPWFTGFAAAILLVELLCTSFIHRRMP